MEPQRGEDQFDPNLPQFHGYGCGCSAPGPGLLLLVLTIVLIVILASDEELRGSPLWLILIPLIGGYLLLYVRVGRFRGK